MATFCQDTFTDTDGTLLQNHTGETGATWAKNSAKTPSDMEIMSNRVGAVGAAIGFYLASGTPATAEYDVECSNYVHTVAGKSGVGGRIESATNTGYIFRYEGSAGAWELWKVVSNTYTKLGSYAQTLSTATAYTSKLEIRDAAKKGYSDGVERISTADNAITAAGSAGVWVDTAVTASSGIHLDDFTATDPSTGTAVALSGTMASVSTASGALSRDVAVSGTMASVSTLSGTLSRTRSLSGSMDAVSALSAGLGVRRGLGGSMAGVSGLSGGLGVARPLAGTMAGTSALSGALMTGDQIARYLILTAGIAPRLDLDAGSTPALDLDADTEPRLNLTAGLEP